MVYTLSLRLNAYQHQIFISFTKFDQMRRDGYVEVYLTGAAVRYNNEMKSWNYGKKKLPTAKICDAKTPSILVSIGNTVNNNFANYGKLKAFGSLGTYDIVFKGYLMKPSGEKVLIRIYGFLVYDEKNEQQTRDCTAYLEDWTGKDVTKMDPLQFPYYKANDRYFNFTTHYDEEDHVCILEYAKTGLRSAFSLLQLNEMFVYSNDAYPNILSGVPIDFTINDPSAGLQIRLPLSKEDYYFPAEHLDGPQHYDCVLSGRLYYELPTEDGQPTTVVHLVCIYCAFRKYGIVTPALTVFDNGNVENRRPTSELIPEQYVHNEAQITERLRQKAALDAEADPIVRAIMEEIFEAAWTQIEENERIAEEERIAREAAEAAAAAERERLAALEAERLRIEREEAIKAELLPQFVINSSYQSDYKFRITIEKCPKNCEFYNRIVFTDPHTEGEFLIDISYQMSGTDAEDRDYFDFNFWSINHFEDITDFRLVFKYESGEGEDLEEGEETTRIDILVPINPNPVSKPKPQPQVDDQTIAKEIRIRYEPYDFDDSKVVAFIDYLPPGWSYSGELFIADAMWCTRLSYPAAEDHDVPYLVDDWSTWLEWPTFQIIFVNGDRELFVDFKPPNPRDIAKGGLWERMNTMMIHRKQSLFKRSQLFFRC